jgi:NADP-dependent 3-hydroxy acid dehydrogenase YdfG
MTSLKNAIVCITGASSGIGAACATEFARQGSNLILLARRRELLESLATGLYSQHSVNVRTIAVDLRNQKEVQHAFDSLDSAWSAIDILVNNAGLSRGLAPLHEGSIEDWEEMIDTNFKGLLYVSKAILPAMVRRNKGHIINIGSISGHQTYPGGNVYSASKFAVVGLTRSLKMDLLGTAIRVSSVEPGLVQTDFSKVRFRGDRERAAKVYSGYTPLRPEDVAEVVVFCATRPSHVNVFEVSVLPTDQASVTMVNRTS